MRKLAWFSGGFAAACLWACYFQAGVPLPLAAAALTLAVWLAVRPRQDEHPLLLRRPKARGPLSRYALYQLSRRGLALCLGALAALLWARAYSAMFRAPAEDWIGDETALSGEVSSYPAPTSIGGYSVTVHLDGGFFAPDALVYGPADWGALKPGDHVACTARVAPSTHAYGDETTYYTAKGVYCWPTAMRRRSSCRPGASPFGIGPPCAPAGCGRASTPLLTTPPPPLPPPSPWGTSPGWTNSSTPPSTGWG